MLLWLFRAKNPKIGFELVFGFLLKKEIFSNMKLTKKQRHKESEFVRIKKDLDKIEYKMLSRTDYNEAQCENPFVRFLD